MTAKSAAEIAAQSAEASAPHAAEEMAARAAIVATAQEMSRRGLSPGRSGNVSQRWHDGMLITPTGLPYGDMQPEDIACVGPEGTTRAGEKKPSSEWRFHLAVYAARADVGAIVHTHSTHTTVLACAHKSIPAFHYMVAAAGGDDIPCVPYATFGTGKLARHVAKGLEKRNACLMANHGMIAVGSSSQKALDLASEVEILAEQYVKLLAIAKPIVLDKTEMARVLKRFASYGQTPED